MSSRMSVAVARVAAGSDTDIFSDGGAIHGVTLIPGSATSDVIVADGATATVGNQKIQLQGAANGDSVNSPPVGPIRCTTKITVNVTGTGAVAFVYYSPS